MALVGRKNLFSMGEVLGSQVRDKYGWLMHFLPQTGTCEWASSLALMAATSTMEDHVVI